MDYRWFISRRYLFSPRRFSVISVITGISIVGVGVGVTALIVVLSVMNGFYDFVQELLTASDPDVRIEASAGAIANPDSVLGVVISLPHVESATPMVSGKALIRRVDDSGDVNKVVIVHGVDSSGVAAIRPEVVETIAGYFDLSRRDGRSGVIVGFDLSERMGMLPGGLRRSAARVQLLSAPAIERTLTQLWPAAERVFEVRGVYDLRRVTDESVVYVGLADAQQLFRMGSSVSSIEISARRLKDSAAVKRSVQDALGTERFRVSTWYDLQRAQYDAMKVEKWAASMILALIIVVAAFTIVGSLTMVVIEKRRDVGVLQAMGVTRRNIRRIFLIEGFLLGSIGTGVGLLFGLGLVWLQARFELVPLAGADSFLISAYPVAVRFGDVAAVVVVALALAMLASVYPAFRAASVEPASAIASDG